MRTLHLTEREFEVLQHWLHLNPMNNAEIAVIHAALGKAARGAKWGDAISIERHDKRVEEEAVKNAMRMLEGNTRKKRKWEI